MHVQKGIQKPFSIFPDPCIYRPPIGCGKDKRIIPVAGCNYKHDEIGRMVVLLGGYSDAVKVMEFHHITAHARPYMVFWACQKRPRQKSEREDKRKIKN